MKYKKIGQGRVLRCWENKIRQLYGRIEDNNLFCRDCNNLIGEIKSRGQRNYVKMNRNQFTYSGTKISK
ncbi:hypothetical protein [Orenia marismortui]|uniref:hypothetical protein n=1 Tax=Orenia marismortui TaxID=46469 RepID=UPI00036CFF8A|nr:hypothetical protein [Orenia marismortui]